MKPQFKIYFVFLLLSACEINQKDIKPEDQFIKIYNNQNENLSYFPVSVIQTSDGGYLILNGVKNDSSLFEYPSATLIKTNPIGEIEWTTETAWLAPAGLIKLGESYSFIAMDKQNDANRINIDISNGNIGGNTELGLKMPLVARTNDANQFIVLAYNYVDRTSVIAMFDQNTTLVNSSELNINTDMVAQIQAHMNKTGSELPFFIGDWANENQSGYFVNCLANYTLRNVFFDKNIEPTGGDIYSFQARDALSSLVNKENNTFAMTRYYGGNNYISTNIEVDPNTSQNFNDYNQKQLYELVPEAKVVSKNIIKDDKNYIIFASTTNSNSVVLYQYSMGDSEGEEEAIYAEYIDFSDKIEVRDILQDENDGGIILLLQHYFTGKYKRPVLIKIPLDKFKTTNL
jgi:hypothetical protein